MTQYMGTAKPILSQAECSTRVYIRTTQNIHNDSHNHDYYSNEYDYDYDIMIIISFWVEGA